MKTKLHLCVLAIAVGLWSLFSFEASAQTTIFSTDFETGTQEGWTIGSNGFFFNNSSYACNGSYLLAVYDNTTNSRLTSPTFDASPYAQLDLSYCFQVVNFDNTSDGYRVEYFDGSSWITVATYIFLTDIPANNTQYTNTVTITNPPTTFPANAQFRFQNLGTSSTDYFLVDEISVVGYTLEPQREIQVEGNGIEIVDGDTTPSTADNTDFGNAELGATVTNTFNIRNLLNVLSQSLTLNSPYVSISGSADFSVASFPANNTIASGGNETFDIAFTPSAAGAQTATVTVHSNDLDEGTYTFDITGNGINEEFTFFYETFDENNGGWTVTGSGTTWVWGTAPATSPGEALEGSVWHTNNYNNYGNNANTTVTSPILSTTGYQNITFSLDIRINTEATLDGVNIEYRRRSSGTWSSWTILGNSSSGTNWYTDATVSALSATGWSGDSNTGNNNSFLETGSIALPSTLDNSAEIQFRANFRSDGSNTDDGAYFDNLMMKGEPIATPSEPTVGPGDVTNKLRLWLKADSEVGTLSNGTDITSWRDEAYDNNAFATTADAPSFRDNGTDNINFNPTVVFDRANTEFMRGKGGFASKDYYVVVYPNNSIDNTGTNRQVPIAGRVNGDGEFAVDGTGLGLGNISARFTDEVVAHMVASVPDNLPAGESYGRALTSTTEVVPAEPIIFNVRTNAAGTQTEIYQNGERIDNTTGVTQVSGDPLPYNDYKNVQYYLGVGRFSLNGNVAAFVDGRMSEIVSYDNINTSVEQQRIQSYLALKYGITLKAPSTSAAAREGDIDYLDSNGDMLWDVSDDGAGFNYDIAGIGRDDESGLNQKQSRTSNTVDDVTISLGEIYTTNSANPNSFVDDRDFLVWGNDGGDLTASGVVKSVDLNGTFTTFTEIVNRKWKIVERTNGSGTDIGKVFVSIPFNTLDTSYPKGPNQEYALLVSSDAAFADTDIVDIIPFTETAGSLDVWYDFDDTRYFTVGVADRSEGKLRLEFQSGDYIVSENDINLNADFTISTWVRDAGSGGTVFAKDTDYEVRVRSNGRIDMDWNGSTRISSTTNIDDGRWHQISVIKSGTTASLYIDGVFEASASVVDPISSTSTYYSIGVIWADKNTISTAFDGDIDEIRIWDTALTLPQLRYIMNQEIEEISNNVEGEELPITIARNDISGMPWGNLQAYYDINNFYGTSIQDKSDNGHWARIKYLRDDKRIINTQTAPLPYQSNNNGSWDTNSTWFAGPFLQVPNALSIVDGATRIDWNIVSTDHNITLNRTAQVLGMLNNSGELEVLNNNGITVSHYFLLDGVLDLEGESQLIQENDSELAVASSGYLERDQQGTADSYTYNYWGTPVGEINTTANNQDTTVGTVLMDGSNAASPQNINFQPAFTAADGGATNPIIISSYWLFKFVNGAAGDYGAWQAIGDTGTLTPGEGYTMKGSGTGPVGSQQNYVFQGKPNNGTINGLTVSAGHQYLVGNPYASSIDAHEFIDDNTTTTGALYFWEHWGGGTHTLDEYQGGYAVRTKAGGTPAASHPLVNQTGSGTITPGRYVPVAQGFYIEGGTGGTITFENDQRVFVTEASSSSNFIRGNPDSSRENIIEDTRSKLRIGFDSPSGIHRQLLVTVDETTTNGIDWGYEGAAGEIQSEDMFWTLNAKNYLIQAVPELADDLVLDLNIKTDENGLVEIGIDEFVNFEKPQEVYVLDKLNNTTHDISSGKFSIQLDAGEYEDRFAIVFTPSETLGVDDLISEDDVQVGYIKSDQTIKIRVLGTANNLKQVSLYNALGQQIRVWDVDQQAADLPTIGLSKGVYIVKAALDMGTITKKVIIE